MNLTLNKSSIDPIERLLNALTEFIDNLKHTKKTFADNVRFCRELRTNRKKFEKEIKNTINCFHSLPESQQVELELIFHKALRRLQLIAPKVYQEIEDDHLFILFSFCLKRELRKTLTLLKKTQVKMATELYSDPTEEIMSDSELQKQLIEQWGDLANEEY